MTGIEMSESFHLFLYVRSENRRRFVTASEPRTRDIGKPESRIDDSIPHLRFTTRAEASFFYHGSPKSWDEWHLVQIAPCKCENTTPFEQAAIVPLEPNLPTFWGPRIQRLPYKLRFTSDMPTPVSH